MKGEALVATLTSDLEMWERLEVSFKWHSDGRSMTFYCGEFPLRY